MQTEFRAIVQSEYGAPEKVLRIAKRQLKSEELGADDVLVKVIARPIHPGDIQSSSRRTGRAHSPDLVHRPMGGLCWGYPRPEVALDVLDDDDSVVNYDPDC
jgi:hypothetical protein